MKQKDGLVDSMATQTSSVCAKVRACTSSLCWESAVVALTVISVLAVCGEMLIDFGILTVPSDQAEQQPSSLSMSGNDTSNGGKTVGSESSSQLEVMRKVFRYVSLAIAALFFVEIVIKLVVFRKNFMVRVGQVLDMLVVVAAVIFEVTFEIKDRIPELEACTFVIVFRLWRLPHICNMKAEALRSEMEQDLQVWKASKGKLEDRWRTLQARYEKQKEKIVWLEQEILVLKREKKASQNLSSAASSYTTTAFYDHVPHPTVEGFSSNQHGPNPHVEGQFTDHPIPDDFTASSRETEGRTAGETEREEEAGRQRSGTDSAQEGPQQNGAHRKRFQSDSESSLSGQELERPVHVQIERQNEVKVRRVSGEEDNPGVDSAAPQLATEGSREESGEYFYDNEGFSPDSDHVPDSDLPDENDSKTYTSAEGIPMTDL